MQNLSEIAPVTQHELTQTDIDYSVKVSKQVIISKLKSEIDALAKLIKEQHKSNSERFTGKSATGNLANDLLVIMRKQFKLWVNNDTAINHLRLAINGLTDNSVKTNFDLVHREDCYKLPDFLTSPDGQMFEHVLRDGTYPCTFYIVAFLPDAKELYSAKDSSYADDVENLTILNVDLAVPQNILDSMKEAAGVNEIIQGNYLKLAKLKAKLTSIDTTMEELEAKLLVNHLSKTDHGKEVLAVTSSLVTELLGDATPLLAEF